MVLTAEAASPIIVQTFQSQLVFVGTLRPFFDSNLYEWNDVRISFGQGTLVENNAIFAAICHR